MKKIIIFSPNPFSLYSICVTALLRRNSNVEIQAIVVRKLLNISRFFSEFRRDGNRLIKKIWAKAILKERAYSPKNYETIIDYMNKENISIRKLGHFFKQHDIPVIECLDLNDSHVLDFLKKANPHIIVFTGGGLIRSNILNLTDVLNCHIGILPGYRGMDVLEWAILDQRFDNVGLTVHLMDKGVDTGNILKTKQIDITPYETVADIRNMFEPIMCREIVSTCLEYLDGKRKPYSQRMVDGKQYFKMHPRLFSLVEQKLSVTQFLKKNDTS